MRLPRDISATELISSLQKLGYFVSRQKGSHIRLTTTVNGVHHITVPNHSTIRLGTFSSILADVAAHFKQPKEEIAKQLFG
ncbi:MAG TPA: type II toxin-antitoxin system HicA family toxin [Chitinophagaceae bacterium]|jgi:predicted RNA binding protein YcfA (HicA-like mRNA interferase family)|nr:type II toxin-antitoxin system HicA family toxin [Chitinophagaceae bacterium]